MRRSSIDIISCGACRHPEVMTRRGGGFCPVDFPSMVGVIRHPEIGVILFDTGYDPQFFEATTPFPERFYRWTTPVRLYGEDTAAAQLARMGIAAEDVAAVVLSHFHADHAAGLHQFKNAAIFCAKAGLQSCAQKSRIKMTMNGILPALIPADILTRCVFFEDCATAALPARFAPFDRAADILGDGTLLMVELPGHCPGHWGMIARHENDQFIFFVADAAWSITAIEHNAPPPKITTALLGSTQKTRKTLSDLHTIARRKHEDIFFLPSHCASSIRNFQEKV